MKGETYFEPRFNDGRGFVVPGLESSSNEVEGGQRGDCKQ
jgi:hypothetical protein